MTATTMPRDFDYGHEGEGKWESKYDDDDGEEGKSAAAGEDEDGEEWACLPGMGQEEEDTLLVRAMEFTNSDDFKGEMNRFVAANVRAWEDSADLQDTGEGSSHERMEMWKAAHQDYLDLFEALMETFVRRDGSDLMQLMQDCRDALKNKYGWLFEDENYAGFVDWMKSVLDFEHFHQMMRTAARTQLEVRAHRK